MLDISYTAYMVLQNKYDEWDEFIQSHPAGGITQSSNWHYVKGIDWKAAIIMSKTPDGAPRGGLSVLARGVPLVGHAILYAPRGPVCDFHDREVLEELFAGVKEVTQHYGGCKLTIDPYVMSTDQEFIDIMADMGFTRNLGAGGFETIQPRFIYRLYFNGRSEEEVFAAFGQKTRYNIRLAEKHGVEIRQCKEDALDDFMRLMKMTGERDGFTTRSRAYFKNMLHYLKDRGRLYMAYYNGAAVAGAIVSNYAGKACYLYGASDNAHRNVMPNYLLQWEMIRWAMQTGCTVYDFQGISGNIDDENDPLYGLYRFKKGFNGQVDELAGEFEYILHPRGAKAADAVMNAGKKVRGLLKKTGAGR